MWNFSQFFASKNEVFWGWFFLIFGSVFFTGFFYAAVISKFLPPSDNSLISAIQNDRYYCFLVPLTLPVLVVAVYFHWLSSHDEYNVTRSRYHQATSWHFEFSLSSNISRCSLMERIEHPTFWWVSLMTSSSIRVLV